MNIPTNPNEVEIPDQARGNPVYEQTRQDMPLWCCGRNCGRNSRIVVFVLGVLGIACSSVVCLSPHYFSFVSLRNDTFYDIDKQQPKPFEYATEANVGLFRYEILEVYEYPWPPPNQRALFDEMHQRELQRLDAAAAATEVNTIIASNNLVHGRKDEHYGSDSNPEHGGGSSSSNTGSYRSSWNVANRLLPNKFPDDFYDDDAYNPPSYDDDENPDSKEYVSNNNSTAHHQNETTSIILTRAPSDTPPIANENVPISEIPDVLPGSNAVSRLPTTAPTVAPTRTNPNDLIDVDIGIVKSYPAGVHFDSLFKNGRMGAMWAPILATIGLAFSLVEFCCCTYKCSWLPTALFLYAAFMLQLMTMFLFMSEDFCKYNQDCALGFAGFLSVVAVLSYMISQMLVCTSPRPPPIYNLCKKPPVRRKKKKNLNEFDETEGLADNEEDGFVDEPNGYIDPYDAAIDDDNYYNTSFDNDAVNGDQELYGDEGQNNDDYTMDDYEEVGKKGHSYEDETAGTVGRRKYQDDGEFD